MCQVCGEAVLEVDEVGWVLDPVANMGGACCTRCMYLAVRACPHLHGVPTDPQWTLWAVDHPRAYTWHRVDGATDGHVVVDPDRATRHDWESFLAHRRAWRIRQERSWSLARR